MALSGKLPQVSWFREPKLNQSLRKNLFNIKKKLKINNSLSLFDLVLEPFLFIHTLSESIHPMTGVSVLWSPGCTDGSQDYQVKDFLYTHVGQLCFSRTQNLQDESDAELSDSGIHRRVTSHHLCQCVSSSGTLGYWKWKKQDMPGTLKNHKHKNTR